MGCVFYRVIICVFAIAQLVCCTKTVYIPTTRVVRDTVTLKDTIVKVNIQKEFVSVIADTSAMAETSFAIAEAKVESSKLRLELRNKDSPVEVKVKYVERVRIDSVCYPVPYEIISYGTKKTPWYDYAFRVLGCASVVCVLLLIAIKKIW